MKQKVEEVSTSMYDIQTKTCNGKQAKIIDVTIKVLKCDNNQVTVQEVIPITICGVQEPYGIHVDVNGNLHLLDPTKDKNLQLNKVLVGTGTPSNVGDTSGDFILGEGTSSSATYRPTITAIINCSNYLQNAKSEDERKQAIKDCIRAEYITNVDWKLAIYNKQQTGDSITYSYKDDLGSLYDTKSSTAIHRLINTKYPSQCLSTTTTQTQETQNLEKITLDCTNDVSKKEVEEKIVGYLSPDGKTKITKDSAPSTVSSWCDLICKGKTCYVYLDKSLKKIINIGK